MKSKTHEDKSQIKCPVCGENHDYLVHRFHKDVDAPIVEILAAESPGWRKEYGACTRCLDQAQLELTRCFFKGTGEAGEVNGYKIFPTPVRLRANEKLTGKGVTICLIDSGFYPHPDLVFPENRILAHMDVTDNFNPLTLSPAHFSHPLTANLWHGTMTSVVAAGNGHLSDGMYRGIANEANLVLLKVTDGSGAITGENIVRALEWAVANRRKYNIRIINLSVTDDVVKSYLVSEIDNAIQKAVDKGISVVAAAGNDPNAPVRPPANSPHAITVGGLNDRNSLDPLLNTLYHSTFGLTVDAFQKPDIIAPAIWLAAPVLPGTQQQQEAGALFQMHEALAHNQMDILQKLLPQTRLDRNLLFENAATIRAAVAQRIGEAKYISAHYQHADGTSFAAPIVCSVIAQMLQANPLLDPATIREIILVTAKKLPGEHVDRQGWGVIQPNHAVQMALGKKLTPATDFTPVVDYLHREIEFYLHHQTAKEVVLTGDFSGWSEQGLPLKNEMNGHWKARLPFNKTGTFRYKFLIDNQEWISDPRNLYREPDGFNGFNSKLIIL